MNQVNTSIYAPFAVELVANVAEYAVMVGLPYRIAIDMARHGGYRKIAESIEWERADPVELEKFDQTTKTCLMNCGPSVCDPRSSKERLFLCDLCLVHEAGGV